MSNSEKILLGVSVASLGLTIYFLYKMKTAAAPIPSQIATTPVIDTSPGAQIERYFASLWGNVSTGGSPAATTYAG